MNDDKTVVSGGVGVTGLLGVAFVILKLLGVINWRWIWVLCPFLINIVIIVVFILVAVILALKKEIK